MTSVQIGSKDMRAKESRCTSVTNHLVVVVVVVALIVVVVVVVLIGAVLVAVVIIKIGQTPDFPSFNNYQWRFAEQ